MGMGRRLVCWPRAMASLNNSLQLSDTHFTHDLLFVLSQLQTSCYQHAADQAPESYSGILQFLICRGHKSVLMPTTVQDQDRSTITGNEKEFQHLMFWFNEVCLSPLSVPCFKSAYIPPVESLFLSVPFHLSWLNTDIAAAWVTECAHQTFAGAFCSLLTEADAGHTEFMDEVYQNETRFPGGEWKPAAEPYTDVVKRHTDPPTRPHTRYVKNVEDNVTKACLFISVSVLSVFFLFCFF